MTENTKKVARCFYALEQERADRKRYPAINPIDSYSKYLEYPEFADYVAERVGAGWIEQVSELKQWLIRGKEISEQINILGDDGVPLDYHVTFWKSELIDFIICQQDAFDSIDCNCSLERQEFMVRRVMQVCHTEFSFEGFVEVGDFFKELINAFRQMNYAEFDSDEFRKQQAKADELVSQRAKN